MLLPSPLAVAQTMSAALPPLIRNDATQPRRRLRMTYLRGACLRRACLLLPALLTASAAAQPAQPAPRLRFQHLSIEDGLSQVSVSAVLQDRRGFMWFGTEDGLNRYDGYHFTVYRPIPFDTTSLLDTGIMALAEDRKGAMRVSVQDREEWLDPCTDSVHGYGPPLRRPEVASWKKRWWEGIRTPTQS